MASPNQSKALLRALAVATFIVSFWFINRIFLRSSYKYHEWHHVSPSGGHMLPAHKDTLSEKLAEEYCQNYRLPVFPRDRNPRRKIFDLLLINTELEMLEIRLGQMAPYVDYFVILESNLTFTDKPKPLYVEENWSRFKKYHHQIIRRTMDLSNGNFSDTWSREKSSRNAMYSQVIPTLKGEHEASIDDVLLVSDVDEILKPAVLKAMRNCQIPTKVTIHSEMYYYGFQWLQRVDWEHPQATTYQGPDTILPEDLRFASADHHFMRGAWHCSYCFSTVKEMAAKLASFSHTEMNTPEFRDPDNIVKRVRHGNDLFGRDYIQYDRIENNRDIPEYITKHQTRYTYLIDRDGPNAGFVDYSLTGNTTSIAT